MLTLMYACMFLGSMATQVESSHLEGSPSIQTETEIGMFSLFKFMYFKYLHLIYYMIYFLGKTNTRGKTRGVKWKRKRDEKSEPVVVEIPECQLRAVGDNAQ